MRLLLDEQQDPAVADRLREEGFEVTAAVERSDLRSLRDEQLLELAAADRRAFVTEDVRDLSIIHRRWFESGRTHYGIVITGRKRFPRAKESRRRLLSALRSFLREHRDEDAFRDQMVWL